MRLQPPTLSGVGSPRLAPSGAKGLSPLPQSVLVALTCPVFVSNEVLLDLSFESAWTRFVILLRDGYLLTASRNSYDGGVAGLVRVGPLRSGLGTSRLVEVEFQEPVTRADSGLVALRWEAIGPGGKLFPALDATLTMAPHAEGATSLKLDGVYRPPLGPLGVQLDRLALQKVASATVLEFLRTIGNSITDPERATASPPEIERRTVILAPDAGLP